MAGLEGTIKEFGVADILQLICQQQKTGVLTVEAKGEKAEIYLDEGNISTARITTGPAADALGLLLVKAKLLSPEQLQAALATQKQTFEQLGEILMEQGVVARQDIERAIQIQIYETFYDIFQWKDGTYQFNPKEVTIKSPLYQLINIQSILLDVLRMIDEWPDIKRVIPSFNCTFQPVSGSFPLDLDDDGLLVFNLIDGLRTAQEIIDESLMGRFNTCKILSILLQAGHITRVAAAAAPSRSLLGRYARHLGTASHYSALALALVVIALLPTTFPGNILPLLNPKLVQRSYLTENQRQKTLVRIENALEVYKIRTGKYPAALQDLAAGNFLPADAFETRQGETIVYSPGEESYRLAITPAGTAR
jgi:hypothetical protein